MRNLSLSLALVCLGAPLPAQSHAEAAAAATDQTLPTLTTEKASGLNEALRDEIIAMAVVDQDIRKNPGGGRSKQAMAEMKRVDDLHEKRMKEIIAQYGWPGISLVGPQGSSKTWLIVQHCSQRFQEQCLPLLEHAVAIGEATAKNHAYLLDRVRMHQGKPQVYGTQFRNNELWKLEDPEHVDDRRRAVGLGTMAEYSEQMNKLYNLSPPTIDPSPSPLPNAPKVP